MAQEPNKPALTAKTDEALAEERQSDGTRQTQGVERRPMPETETTPEERADAAIASDPAMSARPGDRPLPRRRPRSAPLPADATPAQIAQAEAEDRLAATDTTHMSESERLRLEVDAGVKRRVDDETLAAEQTLLAAEAQQRESAAREEYEAQLAAYQERDAARRAATPDDALPTPSGMTRIVVTKNFTLVHDDGESDTYTTTGTNCGIPGTWDIPEADAQHWYVLHHSDNPPELDAPMPGTPAAIAVAQRQQARRALIEASLDQEEQAALDAVRSQRRERLKAALGDAYEPTP